MSTTNTTDGEQHETNTNPGANEFAASSDQQTAAAAAAIASASASVAPSSNASGHQQDILSGWDPEQIASLVSAARATATGNQATDASAAHLYEQARHALANLPSNLGQAASTLSEFAAGFKRSDGVSEEEQNSIRRAQSENQQEEGEQEQAAAEGDGRSHADAKRFPTNGQAGEESHGESGQPQSDSSEQHGHDPAATAAAIAAMGGLAGASEGRQDADVEQSIDADDPDKMSGEEYVDEHGNPRKGAGKKLAKSPETDRQRKDSHKEVERKRRAAINLAIAELQTIVPNCEGKNVNKGDIIFKAAHYIRALKDNEASNIEKWTLEKLLMDQATNDLNAMLAATRQEVERLRTHFGKEADEVPRAEELSWADQSGAGVASGSSHHGHGMEVGFDQQHHQPQHLDSSTGGGASGDVAAAAAAAAAARVVAVAASSNNEAEQGRNGRNEAHAGSHSLGGSLSSSEDPTMRENVEAVRAAAAVAAAATSHQQQQQQQQEEGEEEHQEPNRLPLGDEESTQDTGARRASKRSSGNAGAPPPYSVQEEGASTNATQQAATTTVSRNSKRQRI